MNLDLYQTLSILIQFVVLTTAAFDQNTTTIDYSHWGTGSCDQIVASATGIAKEMRYRRRRMRVLLLVLGGTEPWRAAEVVPELRWRTRRPTNVKRTNSDTAVDYHTETAKSLATRELLGLVSHNIGTCQYFNNCPSIQLNFCNHLRFWHDKALSEVSKATILHLAVEQEEAMPLFTDSQENESPLCFANDGEMISC